MPRADQEYTTRMLQPYVVFCHAAYLEEGGIPSQLIPGSCSMEASIGYTELTAVGEKLEWSASACPTDGSKDSSVAFVRRFFAKTEFGVHLFYDEDEDEIVVAFRGTRATSFADLIKDAAIASGTGFPFPREFEEQIKTGINTILDFHPDAKLTFVGHSLGGYLAKKFLGTYRDDVFIQDKDIIAICIDSPGIEELAVPNFIRRDSNHSNRLHNIVTDPHFINAMNARTPVGRLIRLVNSSPDIDVPRGVNVIFHDRAVMTILRERVIAPALALLLNNIPLNPLPEIKAEDLVRLFAGVQSVVTGFSGEEGRELLRKVQHTLKLHDLGRFMRVINAESTSVHEIDRQLWPDVHHLYQTGLDEWGLRPAPDTPPDLGGQSLLASHASTFGSVGDPASQAQEPIADFQVSSPTAQ